MIGVLLLSHGPFCEKLLESTTMITGPLNKMKAVPLKAGESPDVFGQRVKDAVEELDTGEGVLALVDVLGGTPYNQIGSLSRDLNVEIITGMNMAMLLHLAFERENTPLSEAADKASELGKEAIKILRRNIPKE